jgi:photosynthetic reaction center H subunit
MPTGAITGYVDVAQVVLYAFFIFFAGLVFWLRREDRREGYPLENEIVGRRKAPDPVLIPRSKAFHLPGGETTYAPQAMQGRDDIETGIPARKVEPWPGAPYERTEAGWSATTSTTRPGTRSTGSCPCGSPRPSSSTRTARTRSA